MEEKAKQIAELESALKQATLKRWVQKKAFTPIPTNSRSKSQWRPKRPQRTYARSSRKTRQNIPKLIESTLSGVKRNIWVTL